MDDTMKAKVRVLFGEPRHGWVDVDIIADSGEARFAASYVCDSLAQLVDALRGCMLTPGEYTAVWACEPEEYETRFLRAASGEITLEVHLFPDGHRSALRPDVPALSVRGSYVQVALPFWRALRSVRARVPGAKWDAGWGHPFPDAELYRLTAALHAAAILHGA